MMFTTADVVQIGNDTFIPIEQRGYPQPFVYVRKWAQESGTDFRVRAEKITQIFNDIKNLMERA